MNVNKEEEDIQANNKVIKQPFNIAGETSIDQLNASVMDSSFNHVGLSNPEERPTHNQARNGIVNITNKAANEEETKGEQNNPTSDQQGDKTKLIDSKASKKYARSYQKNKRYKLYWKIFTVVSSLTISGYLAVEAYALNCVIQEKSPNSQSSSTVQYLMRGFLRKENLLFINLYMNFIIYILGLIIILYSVIILLIEYDQPWKWFKGRHKKLARWGYVFFICLYLIGGFVQTVFVLSNLKDPTIQSGGSYYAYMILRGFVFYFNMSCFRKIEKFKLVQTEVFKELIDKDSLKSDQEPKNLDFGWHQLYEVPVDIDDPERAQKEQNIEIRPQEVSIVLDNTMNSGKQYELPDTSKKEKPSSNT